MKCDIESGSGWEEEQMYLKVVLSIVEVHVCTLGGVCMLNMRT